MPRNASGARPGRRQNQGRDAAPSRKSDRLYRPGLVMVGVVLLWAAFNEPAQFDTASVAVWLLGAVTAGLLARAALALAEPALKLTIDLAVQQARRVPPDEAAGE
jgi:hypothetical protein